jgi:hypothetical protein
MGIGSAVAGDIVAVIDLGAADPDDAEAVIGTHAKAASSTAAGVANTRTGAAVRATVAPAFSVIRPGFTSASSIRFNSALVAPILLVSTMT